MAKTIAQLRAEAQTIRDASVVGENTATRVGGTIEDVVDYLDEVGGTFATGEEVGDVSVFDDENDLTGKTDAEKALMIPNGKVIDEIGDDITQAVQGYDAIPLSGVASVNCYLYTNGGNPTWQNGVQLNDGKFYPVDSGATYRIKAAASTRLAMLKDNTHITGTVTNFATGWTNFVTISDNDVLEVVAPSDATYLFVNTHSINGYIEPKEIAKAVQLVDLTRENTDEIRLAQLMPNYSFNNPVRIDVGNYVESDASLAVDKKWVFDNNKLYGKHKAIPVNPGDIYVISCAFGMNFFGFVTSSYSPPYANFSSVPYVSGCDREGASYPVIRIVPTGAAYLIIGTANGSGGVDVWDIFKVDSYESKCNAFTKFRYAHWNIGIFKYYDYKDTHTTSDISDADADSVALEYKKIINLTGANILGICEYAVKYPRSNSAGVTRDIIFPCYTQASIGTFYGNAACNAIFYNSLGYIYTWEKIFDRTYKKEVDPSAAQRYYKVLVAEMAGKNVYIVETHLDWSDDDIRAAQIAELVSAFSGFDHVIISGDFNTTTNAETEMLPFINNGFMVANGGYIGSYPTHEDGHEIDNIVVKGFSMTNIQVNQDAGYLSDHWILSCDLEML